MFLLAFCVPSTGQAQLVGEGTQFWSHLSTGIEFGTFDDAEFGRAVAAGDFNCDSFDDLAIGIPGQHVPQSLGLENESADLWTRSPFHTPRVKGALDLDAGQVLVLYSSGPTGLSSDGHQFWDQDSDDIENQAEAGDQFGRVLATGNFNGDNCDDLVIGIPSRMSMETTRLGP